MQTVCTRLQNYFHGHTRAINKPAKTTKKADTEPKIATSEVSCSTTDVLSDLVGPVVAKRRSCNDHRAKVRCWYFVPTQTIHFVPSRKRPVCTEFAHDCVHFTAVVIFFRLNCPNAGCVFFRSKQNKTCSPCTR